MRCRDLLLTINFRRSGYRGSGSRLGGVRPGGRKSFHEHRKKFFGQRIIEKTWPAVNPDDFRGRRFADPRRRKRRRGWKLESDRRRRLSVCPLKAQGATEAGNNKDGYVT
jgi:hypothetical protein